VKHSIPPPNRIAAFVTALWIIAAASGVGGCAPMNARARPADRSDLDERSVHRLAGPPAQAAECIRRNVERSGYSAEIVPLYGLEAVAVTVRTSPTGDTVAVLSLTRADAGSNAVVTSWSGPSGDRGELPRQAVQGC
jgi:hypothetical protein